MGVVLSKATEIEGMGSLDLPAAAQGWAALASDQSIPDALSEMVNISSMELRWIREEGTILYCS